MTRTSGHLFDEAELREWLQERHGECKAELARLPEARLLEQPIDQMAQSFLNVIALSRSRCMWIGNMRSIGVKSRSGVPADLRLTGCVFAWAAGLVLQAAR